tara:strand:- start:401 stop:577 length:177 start_codon:yes stop_codon:yes gene_type:complete
MVAEGVDKDFTVVIVDRKIHSGGIFSVSDGSLQVFFVRTLGVVYSGWGVQAVIELTCV